MNCLILFLSLLAGCLSESVGFRGRIDNAPDDIVKMQDERFRGLVLNYNNYQSRFNIDLFRLDNSSSEFASTKGYLNKDYEFYFKNLQDGEYNLVINSYDFILSGARYKIIVDQGTIKAHEDSWGSTSYNTSQVQTISEIIPLRILILDIKQYYEKAQGGLSDILLNSPFGFIFKNRTYTIMFTIAVALMIAPPLLQFINPDFAETFNQIKNETAAVRAGTVPQQRTSGNSVGKPKSGQLRQRNTRK